MSPFALEDYAYFFFRFAIFVRKINHLSKHFIVFMNITPFVMSLSVNLCNYKYIQTDWQLVVTFHLLALEMNPFFTIGRDLPFDSVAFINMVSHQLIFVDFANSKVLRICLWFGYNMFLSIETINIILIEEH